MMKSTANAQLINRSLINSMLLKSVELFIVEIKFIESLENKSEMIYLKFESFVT